MFLRAAPLGCIMAEGELVYINTIISSSQLGLLTRPTLKIHLLCHPSEVYLQSWCKHKMIWKKLPMQTWTQIRESLDHWCQDVYFPSPVLQGFGQRCKTWGDGSHDSLLWKSIISGGPNRKQMMGFGHEGDQMGQRSEACIRGRWRTFDYLLHYF